MMPTVSLPSVFRFDFLMLAVSLVGVSIASGQEKSTIDFNRDIKPILSDRCFQCHGPDENQRQADLRLDVAESALESSIHPGSAEKSDLIARILSDDPDEVMPPPSANKKKITAAQIQKLKTWIDQGASFDAHWSYVKPKRPSLPKLDSLQDWAKTDIDQFIAGALETAKRKPAADADKRTLFRRLHFDLIGLPPSQKDLDEFIHSTDPQAYEKWVDRLLNSKAFGERMAVYWLDQVRYADTNGIHGDNHRDHSLFRDYVIDAFNSNLPFDQFTVEQLAGDLLPEKSNRNLIASGYNRLNMTTREGGAQAKEYRAKYAADRVRNASVVWLGSTLGCAECHDHKYDPFASKDFYRFAAFFSDVAETPVGQQKPTRLPTLQQQQRLTVLESELADARKAIATRTEKEEQLFREFITAEKTKLKDLQPAWSFVSPAKATSSGGATLSVKNELITSTGKNPDRDDYTIVLPTELKTITGLRLDCLTDPTFPNQSLARGNGNFVLTNVEVQFNGKNVAIQKALADFSQQNHDVSLAIDKDPKSGWAPSGHTRKDNRQAVFVFAKPIANPDGKPITLKLSHQSIYPKHNIGKFRVALTGTSSPKLGDHPQIAAAIVKLLELDPANLSKEDDQKLYQYFVQQSSHFAKRRQRLDELTAEKNQIQNAFRPILVTTRTAPRMMRVLPRGNWLDDTGEIVKPGVPSFLPQIEQPESQANRLDLAQWIVSSENPLTSRVLVNRLWKICFGEGIVRTPDDFGSQGMVPTHPELLDYLAVEFVDAGWDIKSILKRMVMSRTYQLSSFASDADLKNDPANLLFSRQNRFRLDAEFVRDNALSISGLLIDSVGGDSVKPYQPPGYWRHLNFPKRTYQASKDQNQYRRGLYSYWCRTFLHPSLSVFDAPSREEACVQRPRSNTPLQALVLLNDPTYVEAAQAFAEKLTKQPGSVEERLTQAFQTALNRQPSADESRILKSIFTQHQKAFEADPKAAKEAIQVGNRKTPDGINEVELAAWTSVARIVLNLHETITRY